MGSRDWERRLGRTCDQQGGSRYREFGALSILKEDGVQHRVMLAES